MRPSLRIEGWSALLGISALLWQSCATAPIPTDQRTERYSEAAYLLVPLQGYSRSIRAADADALRAAHAGLVSEQNAMAARRVARALLDETPGLEPAVVLLAQAVYVEGGLEAAFDLVTPVAQRYPDYVAAQLLAGRAAERLDRVTDAFEAFSKIAARSDLADRRAASLRARALEILSNRVEDLLSRGRLEEAKGQVDRLLALAPNEVRTLEILLRYSGATQDPARELEVLKLLLQMGASKDLLRRRALLELEAGDSGVGLQILEDLVAQNPEDAGLADDLDRAKFRWRLSLLPADVVDLLGRSELSRADHAKLLFWLFPGVRYGRSTEGRIASDILDHPQRQEIARVVNLGLMAIDPTLHLFYPDRSLTRRDALQSVLRILGGGRPAPACLGDLDPGARISVETLCVVSARCGLLVEPGDCLAEARASGRFVESIALAALEITGGE